MKTFEIWVATVCSGDLDSKAHRVQTITCIDEYEAMRSLFRAKAWTFKHPNWNKEKSMYCLDFNKLKDVWFVVDSSLSMNEKTNHWNRLFKYCLSLFDVKNNKNCDCGSEKVYGKNCTHSHWCSTQTVTAHA